METPENLPTISPAETAPEYSVPWSVSDTWLGIGLMILVLAGILIVALFLQDRGEIASKGTKGSLVLVVTELLFLAPVAIIFLWKRINWKYLGFRKFKWNALGIGCGILAIVYPLIILHNVILIAFHIGTQGDSVLQILQKIDSPFLFVVTTVIIAPLVEETFFRGFVFASFRQRYGWVTSMLLSSGIFALGHMQLVALIPTFLLGCVLAYTYHRANSIWPGVIIHFLVNGLAVCVMLAAFQLNLLQ